MIPLDKVKQIVDTYNGLEKELASGTVDKKNFVIKGVVSDKGGSTDKIQLRLERKPIKINEDGSFSIKHVSNKNDRKISTNFY